MNRKGGSTRGASMAGTSMAMSEAATSQSGKSAAMAGAVGAAATAAEDAGMASAMQGIEVQPQRYAHGCSRMLTDADVCSRVLTYAGGAVGA